MKVLVLNCGSSSIKYQFIDTVEKQAACQRRSGKNRNEQRCLISYTI